MWFVRSPENYCEFVQLLLDKTTVKYDDRMLVRKHRTQVTNSDVMYLRKSERGGECPFP